MTRRYFYPRSPCGERPPGPKSMTPERYYFYPRSPCGERPINDLVTCRKAKRISIHALLAESDPQCRTLASGMYGFLSTLSLRRATFYRSAIENQYSAISIHALLAESDRKEALCQILIKYFYPRSPCGERPYTDEGWPNFSEISIHALLAESDP